MLRLRGDLRTGEFDEAHAAILEAERRAIRVRVAGEERLVAAEDAGRYRDALGVMPPSGLPDVFLEGGPDSLRSLVARYARGRGPFTTAQAREWFGVDVEPHLRELEREEKLVRGELRPGGVEREWCDPDVLRRLRRASLAALRREVEPAEQAALGRFLPHWHGIDRRASLREALIPLQGLALPVALWESDVLPRRVPGYRPEQLDQLCASGELVWVGTSLDRVAVFFREDASLLGAPGAAPPPEADEHDRIRAALEGSARFWPELLEETALDGRCRAARALGSRLGGRGDQRLVGAATCGAALPAAEAGPAYAALLPRACERRNADAGALVARHFALSGAAGAAGRSPSCCSSGRGSSRATASAAKGFPAATGPSTPSCARSRRWAPAGAATSSKGSAARSSRSAAPWSGCGSCGVRDWSA